MKKPNNITNGVETYILSVQGTRVEHGTVLLVLDAEICYYHRPFLYELLGMAKAMIMQHSDLDNAYITIESYNTSNVFPYSHFSFNRDTGTWRW